MFVQRIRTLAIFLHKKFCASNHTDACGWYYEAHPENESMRDGETWEEGDHKRWYDKAVEVHEKHTNIFWSL